MNAPMVPASTMTNAIEPFSWGYRNGYAIRFAPHDHSLAGGLLVGENGADDAGARPSNNTPDSLHLARQRQHFPSVARARPRARGCRKSKTVAGG
jgi:hypothetical protein